MDVLDLRDIWHAWPVPGPWRLTPLTGGANNRVYRVEAPGARQYVLRVLLNHADEDRLRAECVILAALTEANLPFAVPMPLLTREGLPFLKLEPPGGPVRLLVLADFFAGEHPHRDDAALAEGAASALGMLDRALAGLALSPDLMRVLPHPYRRVREWARQELTGDPDTPLALLYGIGVDPRDGERVAALLRDTEAQLGPLYGALSQQLIHGDFDPSNVLMEGIRVTSVLDFEFATFDLRLLDLVVAFSWWPVAHLGTGAEWPLVDALGRGYTGAVSLTAAECDALPTCLRLRALGSLLHRIERCTQRLASPAEVLARVRQTLWRDDWLTAHSPRLLEMAHGWLLG